MSIAKKTGLYIAPVNQPIIDRVMQENNYTKISNAINFIIQEYDKLTKQDKKEVVATTEEVKPKKSLNDWFVVEESK